ncbi:MAG: hypothetical protein AB4911_10330 [Oscillochloridaceae bacterium umkhey_bin13]
MSMLFTRHYQMLLRRGLSLRARDAALFGPLAFLYLVAFLGLWAVYQHNDTVVLNVGDTYSRSYLHNFYDNEQNKHADFAYTTEGSVLELPGPASGPYYVRLRMSGWRTPPHAAPMLILHSRNSTATIALNRQPATYQILLPATVGNLRIQFESDLYTPTFTDPRRLGVALDWVVVQGLGALPPLTTTAMVLGLITLAWWFGLRVGLTPRWAAVPIGVLLVLLLTGMSQGRLFVTVGLGRWLLVLMLLHGLLWPLQSLLRMIMTRHGLTISRTGWYWLWAIFGLALIFKVGGAIYPHAIFIDEEPHTNRVQMVLDGRFSELYKPGFTSYLGATVGLDHGYIPYSPLWYLIIAPLGLIGLTIGDAMNGLNALLNVSKGLMIFLITLATIRRERAALLASGLYHLLPMPYFLISWGNYPTQFGLWASLLALTFLVLNYEQMPALRQWRRFAIWAALLALVILSYTMIGVMTFTLLGLLVVIKVLRGIRPNRRVILALVAGVILAESFAFLVYHHQFASVFVRLTLPSVVRSLTTNATGELRTDVDPRESPLANFVANKSFMRNHTTDVLLLLATIGVVWLYLDRNGRRYRDLWSAWFGVFLLYTLVSAYVADMVLKHVFFVMPLICIGAGLVLDRIWRQHRAGTWFVLANLLLIFAVTVDRWWFYLLFKRH